MEFEHYIAALTKIDTVTLRARKKGLLRGTEIQVRTVPARRQDGACNSGEAAGYEQIEINKTAQLQVAINLKRQRRSFVRDRGDSVFFKVFNHPAEFSGKHDVSCSVVLKVSTYLLQMTGGHELSEGVKEMTVDERHQSMPPREGQETVPIQRSSHKVLRLLMVGLVQCRSRQANKQI